MILSQNYSVELGDEIQNAEKENESQHSYQFLGLVGWRRPLPPPVPLRKTAFQILPRGVLLSLGVLSVISEKTLAFLLLRIIIPGFIVEVPVGAFTEKIKTESHIAKVVISFYFCKKYAMANIKIGQGFDVHALQTGLPMWLCGVNVPSDKGFVAHSDGDVAIHALCDAILGALALGDIGKLFPDTDPAYKGICSRILLQRVVEKAHEAGWSIGNVDITIALEAPKLKPHIDTMRECLAPILGCGIGEVSVKATTSEKLGFTGRGEGCAVWAVCLLVRDN